MNRQTIAKRRRGLRYGLLIGRSKNLQLPRRIRIGGRRATLNLPDEQGVRTAFAELLLSDTYGLERDGRDKYSRILDIGANVGLFAIAARQTHPRAIIHVYEPNLALGPYLTQQVAVAGATWFPEAVARSEGLGSLEIEEGESVQTRLLHGGEGAIPIVSLRNALDRLGGADFAKIDCEGSEWDMFDDEHTWASIRELAIEYHLHGDRTHGEALDRISTLGFCPWRVSEAPGFGVILATRVP